MKRAFTLIELIAVIVITGIIAVFSTDIILNLYKNYTQTRAINELESKNELALEQISRLLSNRIKESLIARNPKTDEFIAVKNTKNQDGFEILEWLSSSYEAMIFTDKPSKYVGGYSGFIDLQNPKTRRISPEKVEIFTPKSDLESASLTMQDLTQNSVSLQNSRAGLFLLGVFSDANHLQESFGFRLNDHKAKAVFSAVKVSDEILEISSQDGEQIDEISEQYHLIHTAYAIVATEKTMQNDFNLTLKYNYQPWKKDGANEYKNAQSSILAENVTEFGFSQDNQTLIIKLCLRKAVENLGKTSEAVVCKNKAIYS